MKNLFIRIDTERRSFFSMKGTEPHMVFSSFFQGNISGHKINNIYTVPDPVYDIIGEHVIFSAPLS